VVFPCLVSQRALQSRYFVGSTAAVGTCTYYVLRSADKEWKNFPSRFGGGRQALLCTQVLVDAGKS
jgi:hypothetical protein